MTEKRITGSEMEWGVMIPGHPGQESLITLGKDRINKFIASFLVDTPHSGSENSCFLSNGSKFYGDINDKREYATPIDDSFLGTLANEIAGERITRQALDSKLDNNGETMGLDEYYLHKRVISDDGITWGYHENYLAAADKIDICEESLALLGVHMATRNILVGAGYLDTAGNYFASQKMSTVRHSFYNGTTGNNKPVVNLRNEPLADKEQWRRVHVVSGDPNISPWATRLKFGSTSIVLRLIENGILLDNVRFKNELYQVAKQTSRNYQGGQSYELSNGTEIRPVAAQRFLLKAGKWLAKQIEFPEEEKWALEQWDKGLADYSQNYRLLKNRADWAVRLAILEKKHETKGWAWDDKRLRGADRQFDNTAPGGVADKLRQGLWSKWMPPEEMIVDRLTNPPANTRSRITGDFVQAVWDSRRAESARVGWDFVKLNDTAVRLEDPRANVDPRVKELLEETAA